MSFYVYKLAICYLPETCIAHNLVTYCLARAWSIRFQSSSEKNTLQKPVLLPTNSKSNIPKVEQYSLLFHMKVINFISIWKRIGKLTLWATLPNFLKSHRFYSPGKENDETLQKSPHKYKRTSWRSTRITKNDGFFPFLGCVGTCMVDNLSAGQQTNPAIHWSNHVHVGQKFKLFL